MGTSLSDCQKLDCKIKCNNLDMQNSLAANPKRYDSSELYFNDTNFNNVIDKKISQIHPFQTKTSNNKGKVKEEDKMTLIQSIKLQFEVHEQSIQSNYSELKHPKLTIISGETKSKHDDTEGVTAEEKQIQTPRPKPSTASLLFNEKVTMHPQHFITEEYSNLLEKYEIIKTLGKGSFGEVKLAIEKKTHQYYAIKIIDKSHFHNLNELINEISIVRSLDHPNIIRIYEFNQDIKFLYIISESINLDTMKEVSYLIKFYH